MEKIKEALWQNYEEVNDLLEGIDVSSNEFRNLTEERDKIRNELIELERLNQETDVKVTQIECENVREKIRNGINIRNFYCKYNCNCICYNKDIQI